MIDAFIKIRFLDVVDILLVSFLLYQAYMLIRGTVALNIFLSIFIIYLVWLIVRALKMELLGTILGQVISVGIISLIILFQQEIRRFLVLLGTRYLNKSISLNKMFSFSLQDQKDINIKTIVNACSRLAQANIGALIVLTRKSKLDVYANTGDIINANTNSRLIETIFFKNSPLHDGAMIITQDKIHAARCVLPVSENPNLSANFGLRHRAALGITEHTDALAIVVSEETGQISVADGGVLTENILQNDLVQILEREFAKAYLHF